MDEITHKVLGLVLLCMAWSINQL